MTMTTLTTVPQCNPKAAYEAHKPEIDAAIAEVLDSGWYILGEQVKAFELEFAGYLGAGFGIGVASGTDAIEITLRALDIGPGDLVLTVSHTAVATVAAIIRAGATPVLIDVEPEHLTMDPEKLADTLAMLHDGRTCIEGKPKAIIPVHLYGHPADVKSILEIADKYNLPVIEDCAQAHGARIDDLSVGTFGVAGAFSFYPTKNLGALGDGGMVVTNDAQLSQRLVNLRQYGWQERYISNDCGINSRLDELQAAILRVKLTHLESDNKARREIATRYTEALTDSPIIPPTEAKGNTHIYHQYVIRTESRDALQQHLLDSGVHTGIHYPEPVHLQSAYRQNTYAGWGGLGETARACRQILSLPMFPQINDQQIEQVIDALKSWHGDN